MQRRLIKQATTIQATGVTGVQMQNALIYLSREGKPAGRIITKTESDYFVSSVITNLQKYSEPEAMYTLSDVFKLREEWRSQHGPFELFDVWHPEFPNITANLNKYLSWFYFDINFNITETLKNKVLYLAKL